MFVMNDDLSIYATRGDIVFFSVTAEDNGILYKFQPGDIVRMAIYGKKDAETCVMQKDFPVEEVTEKVFIYLDEHDTKIGDTISKHKDYWYEIVLNPDTMPQTIIGYDEDGAKIFRLFPESEEIDDNYDPKEEDFPVVDKELDMTSPRPVSNSAIARAVATILDVCERTNAAVTEKFVTPQMFGASGDGVMDDTEAFEAALRYPCFVPAGTYKISATLTVTDDLIGFSSGATKIVPNGCETVFRIADRVSATVQGLNIVGNDTGIAVSLENVRNSVFADVRVENCYKAFSFVDKCWANTFKSLSIYNCEHGFYNESESSTNMSTTVLHDCYFGVCKSAFEITGGSLDIFGGWVEECDKVFAVTNKANVLSIGCANVDFENNGLLLSVGGGSYVTNINRFSFRDCPFVKFGYWFEKTTSTNIPLYFDVTGSMIEKPVSDIFTADSLWCYWGTNLPEYYLKKSSPCCLYKAKTSAYYNEISIPVDLIADCTYTFPEQVYLASLKIPAGTSAVVHGWDGGLFTWTLTGSGELKAVTKPCFKLVFSTQPTEDVAIKVPRNANVFFK